MANERGPTRPSPEPQLPSVRRGRCRSGHKEGASSTAQGPDGLSVLHLHPLGPHGTSLLT